jgi:hypothetical protein
MTMTDPNEKKAGYEGWAIVELFGHKRMAGYLSTQEIGSAAMIRIDVPETPAEPAGALLGHWNASPNATAAYTKFLGVGSIYGITPCTEEVARKAARAIERHNDPLPVQLPRLPAPATVGAGEDLDLDDAELSDDDEEY